MCSTSSLVLPSATRWQIGTAPSAQTVSDQTSCFRSGLWSFEWPRAMAGVGLPPRGRPSAPGYAPENRIEVVSVCSRVVSMANAAIASSSSRVSSEARSASKSRASIRPTRSSLSSRTCSAASPSSAGSNGAAQSASAYTGSRCSTRLRTTTEIAAAGAILSRRSSAGRYCSSSRCSPSRARKWLTTGSGPSRWLASSNGPEAPDGSVGGVSIATPLTFSHVPDSIHYCQAGVSATRPT